MPHIQFERKRFKEIWLISYPIIIGSAIENVISFTDTAFMGHVGETALAAAAVGSLYYMLLTMMGMGFGMGTQVLIARHFGEKKHDELAQTFQQAIIFLAFAAALFFLISAVYSDRLIKTIVSNPGIYALSVDFIQIRTYAIAFSYANILFRAYFIGTSSTQVIGRVSVISALLNVLLCYLFVFGKFGLPALGIKGAAYASLMAEGIATLIYFFYMKNHASSAHLFHKIHLLWPRMKELLVMAMPTMLQFFISFTAWFSFFLIIEKMSQQALAVSNISRTIYLTILLPLWGFGAATSSLISQEIGAGRPGEIKKILMHSIPLAFGSLLLLCILSLVFNQQIASLFTTDINVAKEFMTTSFPIALGAVLMSISIILFHGVLGQGKTILALFIESSCLGIYLIYTYYQVFHGSRTLEAIWYSETLYSILLGIFSLIALRQLLRPKSLKKD